MPKYLPSPKSVAMLGGAILLALWSLPADTSPAQLFGSILHPPCRTHPVGQAVPTAAPVPAGEDASSPRQLPAEADHRAQTVQQPAPAPARPPQGHAMPPVHQPAPTAPRPASPPGAGSPAQGPGASQPAPRLSIPTDPAPSSPYLPWPTERMRVHVIDGRSQQPIQGAEVVLIETEQRLTTGPDGWTPWFDAPLVRDPRFRPLVQELHGQLGVIVYKNGYRDSIHFGIRVHPGVPAETTVWMYKLGPGDTRIEPVFYEEPYHHIWLVELADRFRSMTQPGEGPERP